MTDLLAAVPSSADSIKCLCGEKPRFLPKFPVFVQDILACIRWQAMSAEERGGYVQLLMLQWVEGSLPGDDQVLLRLAGCSGGPGDHQLLLSAFPACIHCGRRQNAKCARVRAELELYCDSQAKKASKGGLAKAAKEKSARGHAWGMPQSAPPNSELRTPTPKSSDSLRSSATAPPVAPSRKRVSKPLPPVPEPPEPRSGPAAELCRHWAAEWLRTRGAVWIWNRRDGAAPAQLLQHSGVTPEEVKRRMTILLESPVEWEHRAARPSLLIEQWNQFAEVRQIDSKKPFQFETAFEANMRDMGVQFQVTRGE
jgi:hypothetical protein